MARQGRRTTSTGTWMVRIAIIAIVLVVLIRLGPAMGILLLASSMVGLIVLIGGLIVYFVQRRRYDRRAILGAMEIATRAGMPLGPAVEACGSMCGRLMRRRAEHLNTRLEGGQPLDEALCRVRGLLPQRTTALVAVGARHGDPGQAVRQAVAATDSRQTQLAQFIPNLLYLLAVIWAFINILGFVMYYIVPKFQAIFADFGVNLPGITINLIKLSHVFMDVVFVLILIAPVLAILLLVGAARGWEIPLASRVLAPRDRAIVLRGLAVGVTAGQPMIDVVRSFEQLYPRRWMRRRLRTVREALERGSDWTRALQAGRLIGSAEAVLLESAQGAGNLPWAIETLAGSIERRLAYRLQVLMQFGFPITIIVFGLFLLFVTTALFLPLINLMTRLAS